MQSEKNCHYPSLIFISWENISRLQATGQAHTDAANTKTQIESAEDKKIERQGKKELSLWSYIIKNSKLSSFHPKPSLKYLV